jgi:N-acetylmuramoyl-L-alanine amidase
MLGRLPRFCAAAVVAVVCVAWPGPVAAQPPRDRYEAVRALDAAARTAIQRAPDEGAPAARQSAIAAAQRVITRYEQLVRRYPSSGYSDNALYQAADLARALYAAYGRASHRTMVGNYVAWLTREYPSSSLRSEARAALREVEVQRQVRTATRIDPPRPVASTPVAALPPARAATTAVSRPIAPVPSGGARLTLQTIERVVLPDVVRLTLPLEREVVFSHETLADPPRAFIDLQGVTAAAPLLDSAISVDDAVKQVRIGRRPDATRVVLDLASTAKVSVFALYNPFRVVIDTERPTRAAVVPAPAPVERVPVPAEASVVVIDENAVAPAAPAPEPLPVTAAPTAAPPARSPVTPLRPVTPSPPLVGAAPIAEPVHGPDTAEVPVPLPAVPAANIDGSFSLARQLGLGISRIVIDPGHGGHDPGTRAHGTTEAAVVLDIALRLERLLKKDSGLDVVLTRRTDVFIPLEQRTAIANREGADLFLSIHANASRNASARGVETYYLSFASSPDAETVAARENATSDRAMHNLPGIVRAIALNNKLDESRDLAGMVQDAMTTRLAGANTGLRSRGVKKAPFVVLIGAGMPSVLAEVAFLTNRPEAGLVKTPAYRQRVAEALHAAVLRYRRSLKQQSAVATTERD